MNVLKSLLFLQQQENLKSAMPLQLCPCFRNETAAKKIQNGKIENA